MFDSAFSGPGAVSYGFALLAFVAFAVHLGLGWRGGKNAVLLLATVCLSVLWAGANMGFALTNAAAFWTAQAVSDALRMGGWLLFGTVLLAGAARWRVLGFLALAIVCAAVFLLQQPPPLRPDSIFLTPSRAPFGVLLALAIAGLVLTEQIFRRARDSARWAIKPLCLGLGASFVFDLYVFADALLFGGFDATLWAARGFAQALVIPFVAVATVRNREWTIDIAVSRGVVFHSTAFLASGIYLLTVAAAGYYVRYFGGSWGKSLQVGFIFAALLLLGWLFTSGTLRSRLRVLINKHFFSYRYDYRQEWLRFTNLLSAREPGVSTAERSIEALANLVESPAGALWLRNGDGAMTQAGRWNLPQIDEHVACTSALPGFLQRTGWVVNLQDYREDPSRYAGLELPGWLVKLTSAWLVVPVIAQEELIGFVVLALPRTKVDINWEVRDLLKTAARQIGSFLAQIQASEALLEARKFEAFNKMGAFVVHDLKNLVAQLALLLKNAERHRDNPRFQDDMLSTVKHVASRMNKLLLQLSTGSRAEEALRPIHLGRLTERVAQTKTGQREGITVKSAGEVIVLGYEQRFERVVGHLVQNAMDATRDSGAVELGVAAEGGHAVLEVRDTGCGMTESFLKQRLFRPFQTTKSTGMGIGAYEAAQYVQEMGGRIEADSRPGDGTRIRVILPLHVEQTPAAEPAREAA